MNEIINYYTNIHFIEWLAVIASLAYVIFAAYNKIACWPAAIISTVLYTVIFYEYYLWSDSALQIYYLVMALYGWYCWRDNNDAEKKHEAQVLSITTWSLITHVKVIIILTLLSLVAGHLMAINTPADFPYLDAATTVFAVFATYLVTQKVLENWLYWIVIDFVSIYLYVEKALLPTAFLFSLFVVIACFGYFKWLKIYPANTNDPVSI